MPTTESVKEWRKRNLVQIGFFLNRNTDADIIGWLNSVDNKQGYLKDLIRHDMKKSRS